MLLAHGSAVESPWAWHAHPDVWLLVGVLGFLYWRFARAEASRRQRVLFFSGLAALWLHSEWPVHEIAEKYLLSVHMVQHAGYQLIAAPLMLLGLPRSAFRWLFVRPGVAFVTKPLIAAVVFNVVTALSHATGVVNLSLENHLFHFAVHVVLFGAAVVMWMPVLNLGRARELPQLADGARMVYLFLQSVLPTVPASFLTFADGVIYRAYGLAPRVFDLSAVDDQQLAGALMKIYAGSLLWGTIIVIFFRWYAKDQRGETELRWDDVERELARTPAPKEPAP